MGNLLGWATWLGIGLDYVIAAVLIAGGLYLAALFNLAATNPLAWVVRPLRFVGYALIGAGIVLGAVTYGKTLGATDCNAAWKAKNLEAKIQRLEQENAAKKKAAEAAEASLRKVASEKEESDGKVADYQSYASQIEQSLVACRRATTDDDRRMCDIVGTAAAGCRNTR